MRDGLHLLVIDIDVHGQFIMVENVWVTNIYAPNDVTQHIKLSWMLLSNFVF